MMRTYSKNYLKLIDFIKNNQEDFYRIAYSYVKSKEASLDIVQESIYKALKSIEGLKKSKYMKTWFYRILINTSISYIRNNKEVIMIGELPEEPSSKTYTKEDYLDLYQAIDHLKEKDKTVIILRYFEDMKIEDIARVTETNVNTIKSRIYSATKRLKTLLDCEEN